MSIVVRGAEQSDLDALRDVFRRASLTNAGDRAALLAHPEALVWQPDGAIPGSTHVAVDSGGTPLGFATVLEVDGTLELDDLFTDPDSMRQGVATLLIADVVEVARASGHDAIEVTANPHASAFYASAGFVRVGDLETEFGPGSRLRRTVP